MIRMERKSILHSIKHVFSARHKLTVSLVNRAKSYVSMFEPSKNV